MAPATLRTCSGTVVVQRKRGLRPLFRSNIAATSSPIYLGPVLNVQVLLTAVPGSLGVALNSLTVPTNVTV